VTDKRILKLTRSLLTAGFARTHLSFATGAVNIVFA
jgi:hypothetical protein